MDQSRLTDMLARLQAMRQGSYQGPEAWEPASGSVVVNQQPGSTAGGSWPVLRPAQQPVMHPVSNLSAPPHTLGGSAELQAAAAGVAAEHHNPEQLQEQGGKPDQEAVIDLTEEATANAGQRHEESELAPAQQPLATSLDLGLLPDASHAQPAIEQPYAIAREYQHHHHQQQQQQQQEAQPQQGEGAAAAAEGGTPGQPRLQGAGSELDQSQQAALLVHDILQRFHEGQAQQQQQQQQEQLGPEQLDDRQRWQVEQMGRLQHAQHSWEQHHEAPRNDSEAAWFERLQRQRSKAAGLEGLDTMLDRWPLQAQQGQQHGTTSEGALQRVHPMLQPSAFAAGSGIDYIAAAQQQLQQQPRRIPASFVSGRKLYLPTGEQQQQQEPLNDYRHFHRTVTTGDAAPQQQRLQSQMGRSGSGYVVSSSDASLHGGAVRSGSGGLYQVGTGAEGQAVYSGVSGGIREGTRRIPPSFTSPHYGALLGSGAATADLMKAHRAAAGVGGAATSPSGGPVGPTESRGLGRRLANSLGGMASMAGSAVANAVASAGDAAYYVAAVAAAASGGPGALRPSVTAGGLPVISTFPVPAPAVSSADVKAALKAAMDGLETTGIKDEMEAAEGTLLVPLMRHQKLALAWMTKRESGYSQPIGGILADDQGLGKTVSTIALIVTNRPDATRQGCKRSSGSASTPSAGANKRARSVSAASIAGTAGTGSSLGDKNIASTAADAAAAPAAAAEDSQQPGGEGGSSGAGPPCGATGNGAASGGSSGTSSSSSSSSDEEEEEGNAGQAPDEVVDLLSEDEQQAGSRGTNGAEAKASHLQGGTLVVCPTTVLQQWANEIKSKTNPHAGISVHIYHGKGKMSSPATLSQYTVVLTTYATLAMEAPTKDKPPSKKKASKAAGVASEGVTAVAGDHAAARPGAAAAERADSLIDLCEDGDPMPAVKEEEQQQQQQGALAGPPGAKKPPRRTANAGVGEKGGPLYQIFWHRVVLDEAQCIKNRATLAAHAAWSLKARRRWCLSGTPMQNSIDDLYSYFRFLKYEPYSKPATFKEYIKDALASNPDLGYKRLHAILQGVVLRRTKQSKIDGEPVVKLPERRQRLEQRSFSPGEADFYAKLSEEAAASMKRFQAEGTVRQNYVNILWMLLRLRQACNHPWLVKGSQHAYHAQAPPSAEVHAAQKLPVDLRDRLSSTLREHLTECVVCGDVPEDPVVSVCSHVYCAQCVSAQISLAGHGAAEAELAYHCPACGHTLGKHDTFSAPALEAAAQPGAPAAKQGGPAASAGAKEWHSSAKIDALMELLKGLRDKPCGSDGQESKRSVLTAARSVSHARLAAALKKPGSAAAAKAAIDRSAPPMEKVLIFSQWTGMLDLLETPLRKEKFQFRRLDGSMSVAARQTAISDFSHRPEIPVMLVSLKAASLGVNLVSANHVVLLDLWFNPTVEEQAIDRAHRIGQTKAVQVTRITITGSVEDRILALQAKKRQMVAAAFGEEGGGGGLGANRLTLEDLHFLFQPIARGQAPPRAAVVSVSP